MRLQVKVLREAAALPSYSRHGDAGLDLRAAVEVSLKPGERAAVPTGIAVAIQEGYGGFVHARS